MAVHRGHPVFQQFGLSHWLSLLVSSMEILSIEEMYVLTWYCTRQKRALIHICPGHDVVQPPSEVLERGGNRERALCLSCLIGGFCGLCYRCGDVVSDEIGIAKAGE